LADRVASFGGSWTFIILFLSDAAAPAQDGPASGQYFRRIAFMSKSATPHQNFKLGFETVKNARADSLAHPDSFPARVGFFKSWMADAMTAIPRRL
jgi:hypothetical protein